MDAPKPTSSAPASTSLELVNIAQTSGIGGGMAVTKKDAERLVKTGRWKIVGPAEPIVWETKGRPGASLSEDPPVTETASPKAHAQEPQVRAAPIVEAPKSAAPKFTEPEGL